MNQPTMSFFSFLEARAQEVDSLICVGIDPHPADLNEFRSKHGHDLGILDSDADVALAFSKRLINETKHMAAAYKPNSAFFEALGQEGFTTLASVIAFIPNNIPVILDVKRGDISSTASAYAVSAYEQLKAHCVTLHPFMGQDSITPFVLPENSERSRGCFVLCKTSNPSSKDFETLPLQTGELLYEKIAHKCVEWNQNSHGNVGLVVGATDVDAIRRARKAAPTLWILAPGVGFQGGNLAESVAAGLRESDGLGLLIPISRGISRSENPRLAAAEFNRQVNNERAKFLSPKNKIHNTKHLKSYQSDFFKLSLQCGVLKFGTFKLKSSRISPYFFNAGFFNTGSAMAGLGRFYAECIIRSKIEFDVLFAPAYKGIPLAAVIALSLSRDYNHEVSFTYNRKEAKDHGEGGILIGAPVKSKRVLVIDDVITAGTAIRESIRLLKAENASVVGLVIALDRQEKVSDTSDLSAIQAIKAEFGFNVFSIVSLDNLLSFIQEDSSTQIDHDLLERVQAYRTKYGVEINH